MKEEIDKLLEAKFLLSSLAEQSDQSLLQYQNMEVIKKWIEKNEEWFISVFGLPASFVFSISFFYNTFRPGLEDESTPLGCKEMKETTRVSLHYGKDGNLLTKFERLKPDPYYSYPNDVSTFAGSSLFFSELSTKLTSTLSSFPKDEKFTSPLMEAIWKLAGKNSKT